MIHVVVKKYSFVYCLLVKNLRCIQASVNKFDKVQDRLRAARGNWELDETWDFAERAPLLHINLGAGTLNL